MKKDKSKVESNVIKSNNINSNSTLFDDSLVVDYISRSHEVACSHGFHEVKLSIPHVLMLVIGEVGEIVEADRKNRHADVEKCEDEARFVSDMKDGNVKTSFEKYVKDTVEDEMADVAIRIFDICGTFGVEASLNEAGLPWTGFRNYVCGHSVCENCYELTGILSRVDYDASSVELRGVLSHALCFLEVMSEYMGVNLKKHIELKMEFNEGRPMRNGKAY